MDQISEQKMLENAASFRQQLQLIKEEIGKAIVGLERVVEATLTALICGGNVLLEGVPGLGKTELVKTLSQVFNLEFKRIQFTPDLMPADIIGTRILSSDEKGAYHLEFRQGPVFTQLLLADEINRATPKTQSALLETMQEGTVTVDKQTYILKQPFFVLATQNPLEHEGTYPLPEAQMDRFMFKVLVTYPDREELHEIINRTSLKQVEPVSKIISGDEIIELRKILDDVVIAQPIKDYAIRLVLATHPHDSKTPEMITKFVKWGASPRAAQALITASRVKAMAEGRYHVSFDDIRYYINEALQHRIILNYDGQAENIATATLLESIVHFVPEEV